MRCGTLGDKKTLHSLNAILSYYFPNDFSMCLLLLPKDSSDAEVRTALLKVMTSTNERLLKSFGEAISGEAGLETDSLDPLVF